MTLTPFQQAKIAETMRWQRTMLPDAPMPCIIRHVAAWLEQGRKGAFPEPVVEV